MQRLFFSSKSKFFSPFHLNHLVQSFIILLFCTSCPLVLPLLCSLFVPFSQNFALIDPRRGNPLLVSAAHARYSLFWYSSVFTNPPALLQHTEIHTLALTPMSSPGPMRDYTFIGFFFFFLLWGTRSGLMKFNLHTSCWWKVRAQPSHLFWPLVLPCHNT